MDLVELVRKYKWCDSMVSKYQNESNGDLVKRVAYWGGFNHGYYVGQKSLIEDIFDELAFNINELVKLSRDDLKNKLKQ